MIRQFKNKRGISLIEVMVGVAIMGTLASIAIPSYKGYQLSTIKTAYKTDLTSLHKAWLTFGIEGNSFCKRKTKPRQASIAYVGMESLFSSNIHGTHKDSKQKFIGFGKVDYQVVYQTLRVIVIRMGIFNTPVKTEMIISFISVNPENL